jgi:hypothetical protein
MQFYFFEFFLLLGYILCFKVYGSNSSVGDYVTN